MHVAATEKTCKVDYRKLEKEYPNRKIDPWLSVLKNLWLLLEDTINILKFFIISTEGHINFEEN